jgi:predicted phosphodiesterase
MKSLISRFLSLFSVSDRLQQISVQQAYYLRPTAVRVAVDDCPVMISFPILHTRLVIMQEKRLGHVDDQPSACFLVMPMEHDKADIEGFIRLHARGESVIIGSHDDYQASVLGYPIGMDLRNLKITHDGDGLIFNTLVSDAEVVLESIPRSHQARYMDHRKHCLKTIRDIYGGPIQLLAKAESIDSIKQVNEILQSEVYRPHDDRGRPGGILEIPDDLTPIVFGDLHAQVDNLLTLLSQNRFLDLLDTGRAVLIILGDAVHSEVTGELDKMDSSLLIMDIIFRLKIRFPRQVFYIRGNHDSFSQDVFKAGVAQSMMWEHAVRDTRGHQYLEEYKRFYQLLPYLAISTDFVACHAAPIRTKFDRKMLINIHRYPGLVRQLTRNRLRRRNFPAGYHKNDVVHFRKELGVSPETQFLVSHSPLNRKDPLWRDAGRIKHHHIVFSANIPWIGVFTRIDGRMLPLSYHREPIGELIGQLDNPDTVDE